jgi:hypothetical protein
VRFKLFFGITLTCFFVWSAVLLIHFPVRFPVRGDLLEQHGREGSRVSDAGPAMLRSRENSAAPAIAVAKPPKFSMPVRFEPNVGQAGSATEFVGRGGGTTVLLTREGMEFVDARRKPKSADARGVGIKFFSTRQRGNCVASGSAMARQRAACG